MVKRPLKLFVSYAEADEQYVTTLLRHLSQLQREGLIETWHQRRIRPGDDRATVVDAHLETADIILVAVSADSLASDYFHDIELKRSLARHAEGSARVVPIVVRPVSFQTSPLGKLEPLPKDGKPITTWASQDEAWLDVVRGIQHLVEERQEPPTGAEQKSISHPKQHFPGAPGSASGADSNHWRVLALMFGANVILTTLISVIVLRFFSHASDPRPDAAAPIDARSGPTETNQVNHQALGSHATVDAVSGFQSSRIFVRAGQRVTLQPEGRIYIASDQAGTFARAAKPLLVHYLPNRNWPDTVRSRYPLPNFDEKMIFYRDWIGPEGDSYQGDILEECKLRRDLHWGTLLAVILPAEVSSQMDPYEVLAANKTDVTRLVHVPGKTDFVSDHDGWLTFIVNDAVVSPYSSSKDAREFYEALKIAAQELSKSNRHRIPLQSLPLVWYSDNLGAFRITVYLEAGP